MHLFCHRNLIDWLRLVCIDTEDDRNHLLVERIKRRAADLKFYEAFLETAPQFILQISTVLGLGYIGNLAKIIGIWPPIS